MDFAKLDLRTASEVEDWVHLRMGENYLYADDEKTLPCEVKVVAVSSNDVRASLRSVMRIADQLERLSAMLAAEGNEVKRASYEKRIDGLDKEAEVAFEKFLNVAVKDWRNIVAGGKELQFSKEALADFAKPDAPLYRMATEIAQDAAKAQNPFTKAANG